MGEHLPGLGREAHKAGGAGTPLAMTAGRRSGCSVFAWCNCGVPMLSPLPSRTSTGMSPSKVLSGKVEHSIPVLVAVPGSGQQEPGGGAVSCGVCGPFHDAACYHTHHILQAAPFWNRAARSALTGSEGTSVSPGAGAGWPCGAGGLIVLSFRACAPDGWCPLC